MVARSLPVKRRQPVIDVEREDINAPKGPEKDIQSGDAVLFLPTQRMLVFPRHLVKMTSRQKQEWHHPIVCC